MNAENPPRPAEAEPEPKAAAGPAGGRRPGAVAFYACLALVMGGYTALAFGLEWASEAGRIGPGFFPRIIGVLGVLLSLSGLVRSLLPARARGGAGEAEVQTPHPGLLALIGVALAGFVTVLVPVGAPLTGTLLLLLLYLLTDPRHIIRGVVISVTAPALLYVLFQIWLNAGLPSGVTGFLF